MEQAYAQALWQAVERGMEPGKAIRSLRETLERHGRIALLPRICRALMRLAEREKRTHSMTLLVAHEKDARASADAATASIEQLGIAAKEFDVLVDDSLIGGWRLEGAGILVDRSYRRGLLDMYNRAVEK